MLVLTVGSYLFYIAKTTNVSDLQDALKATTVIYDKEGNQAGSLSGQKGTYVELDAISDSLENAVIATEDVPSMKIAGLTSSDSSWPLYLWDALVVARPLPNSWLKMPS